MMLSDNRLMDKTDVQEALTILSDATRFPFIPRSLPKYVEACILNGCSNRLTKAVLGKRLKIFENINRVFELACQATALDPDDLLKRTDFRPSDISPTRLDSAFAEIRTVIFLQKEGFRDITVLGAGNERRADIIGTRDGRRFAIEVANSIFDANKRVEPSQLKDWLIGRMSADNKSEQLQKTAEVVDTNERVIVGVVDTFLAVVFNTHNDYCEAAKLAWDELGQGRSLRVAFVTGREAVGYGPDDCVFPPWPGE